MAGLIFPSNNVPNSDLRLEWKGANLLPRTRHTAIWRARYVHQLGYYAVTWHTSNDGTWHGSSYEFGAHPYPTTGTVNAGGSSTGGTGSVGNTHYYEIAGLGTVDYIASPGPGPTFPVTKSIWVTQARTCEAINGTTIRHTFWPDITNPNLFIRQDMPLATLATPNSPAFIIGCSPWTVSGSTNSETPSATLRGFRLFSEALSIADITTEANSGVNSAVTAAGLASVWYINENPTPTDVSDKSGAGHSPVWANGNRPLIYTGN